MEKTVLKKIRDNLPGPINSLLAPFIRYFFTKNTIFQKTYNDLISREEISPEEIKQRQFEKLKETLIYAYRFVPYYQELFKSVAFDPYSFESIEEISRIPFLTRKIIIERLPDLISTEKPKNGYYGAQTGGSSGTPMKVLLDYDSIYKEIAFIYYFRRKLGYQFTDKVVTFRGIEFGNSFWKNNPMHNEVIFSPIVLSVKTVHLYWQKICKIRPKYLHGYLSAIWSFAKLLKEKELHFDFKLNGIFLISENIDVDQRNFVEEFFKAPTATFYGHSERCLIANEVDRAKYSFDPYYGYTELIPIGDNRFSIVGTGFISRVMPLIRYQTDDEAIGNNSYYNIDGKREGTIGLFGKNNEFLTPVSFDLKMEDFKNIVNYQFIQYKIGVADLLIVVNEHFQPNELVLVTNALKEKSKGVIDLNVKIVEKLKLSPRGKFQKYLIKIS